MYVIKNGSPKDIIAQYHKMIGTSVMPAYYQLGVFLGSNAWPSLSAIQSMVQSQEDSGIAYEGLYLDNYNEKPHYTYTVNQANFNGLPAYVDTMHSKNKKVIFGTSYAI